MSRQSPSGITFGKISIYSDTASLDDIKKTLLSILAEVGYPELKDVEEIDREIEREMREKEVVPQEIEVSGVGVEAFPQAETLGGEEKEEYDEDAPEDVVVEAKAVVEQKVEREEKKEALLGIKEAGKFPPWIRKRVVTGGEK